MKLAQIEARRKTAKREERPKGSMSEREEVIQDDEEARSMECHHRSARR